MPRQPQSRIDSVKADVAQRVQAAIMREFGDDSKEGDNPLITDLRVQKPLFRQFRVRVTETIRYRLH